MPLVSLPLTSWPPMVPVTSRLIGSLVASLAEGDGAREAVALWVALGLAAGEPVAAGGLAVLLEPVHAAQTNDRAAIAVARARSQPERGPIAFIPNTSRRPATAPARSRRDHRRAVGGVNAHRPE